ncbi:molecular chaperone [Salmonella enterica]|nr:molecular chaperone [Salmonella enterica]ECS6017092.1 molecular chaperone [Salmonella enterica subsp. enterica serovar Rough O:k:1,5]EDX2369891.1 molecular chaperone [Salmonella enterica subsp. enterica serovar Memphis]EED8908427.1 molecular chaperone [Salmonella enterica subsp. enterica]EGZ3934262.1 molecular chaperone [Salmonella enterica subsp. enterica serovar Albuquerque]
MKRLITTLVLVLVTGINIAHAGVVIGGTRIIYPANQAEVQVTLKNKDNDKRYLVHSWVSNIDDSKAPFIITPPIYKLEESRQTLLHVVYTGNKSALPQDRESLFMMNVKSVSAIPAELRDNNMLQFAIKTKLKLFYRPASLKESAAKTAWQSLQFSQSQNQLIVKNPTPFYVTFGKLSVAGKAIKAASDKNAPSALTMMVAPFAEQRFPLPSAVKGDVVWTAINDFGSETEQRKQSL